MRKQQPRDGRRRSQWRTPRLQSPHEPTSDRLTERPDCAGSRDPRALPVPALRVLGDEPVPQGDELGFGSFGACLLQRVQPPDGEGVLTGQVRSYAVLAESSARDDRVLVYAECLLE